MLSVSDPKAIAFAEKIGRIIANRFARQIEEVLEGLPEAEDVETFMHGAALGLKEEINQAVFLACAKALEVHQSKVV